MADIRPVQKVKLIVGMLSQYRELFDQIEAELVSRFGEIDMRSYIWPFTSTTYYEPQMGPGIERRFVAFLELADPAELAGIKQQTNELERRMAQSGKWEVRRPINLDPGYVSLSKLVLASAKDYSHRIYLRDGIYAEVTLRFHGGTFRPWPWTYPDYQSEKYIGFFNAVRARLKEQLRQ